MRILIIDDHPLLRRGIREILEEGGVVTQVGEAADGVQAKAQLGAESWDLVLLDLSLPGQGGVDLLREMHRDDPALPILVVSSQPEEQYALRILKEGARGYVTKETAPEELIVAVNTVANGETYVSPKVAQLMARELSRQGSNPRQLQGHQALSRREYEVFIGIAQGQTLSQIAAALSVSSKSISTYRARVMQKMGLENNAQLTRYAIAHQLLPGDDQPPL